MSHPPAAKLDPAHLALALLLLWGVLAPSVACTSRAAPLGDRLDRHEHVEG
jgi:hypothetical protein